MSQWVVYPKTEQRRFPMRGWSWFCLLSLAFLTNTFPAIAGNLIGHWKLDETSGLIAEDSVDTNSARLEGFANDDMQWIQGRISGALDMKTSTNSNTVLIIPDSSKLNFTTNLAFTISLWVRSTGQQSQSAGILAKGFGGGGEEYAIDIQSIAGTYRFFVRDKNGLSWPLVTTVNFSGRWQHLVAIYNGMKGVMNVYVDGALAGTHVGPRTLQSSALPLSVGNRRSGANTGYDLPFNGMIDDLRIYDFALSESEVKQLYKASGPLLPVFYELPQNSSRHTGDTAVFAAIADGTGPLSYQWLKKGMHIAGATMTRLQISDVRFQDEGIYTLQVSDTNNASINASAILKVESYYWQTWWFRALAVLVAMLTVAVIVGLMERRKAQRAFEQLEQRHAVDRERMRIARDMHDEIGGKLSRISLLSEMAQRGLLESSVASRQISEVSNATQDIIRTVDEIVWAVNPRHDNVQSLVYYVCRHAEEFFEATNVELELKQPPELPERQISADVRHHLFCALKEALNNVLKHSGSPRVQVTFSFTQKSFSVRIQDYGTGFTVPEVDLQNNNNSRPASLKAGNGIFNTTERMQSINGEYKLLSTPGTGTVVELTIPLG